MFLGVYEILRATSIRHCGQTKIGISVRAGISIREVARELEEDMELDSQTPGAEGELTASAHVTCSCSTQPRAPTVGGAPRRRRPLGRPRPAPSYQPLCPAPSSPPTSARSCLQLHFADSCSPLQALGGRYTAFITDVAPATFDGLPSVCAHLLSFALRNGRQGGPTSSCYKPESTTLTRRRRQDSRNQSLRTD